MPFLSPPLPRLSPAPPLPLCPPFLAFQPAPLPLYGAARSRAHSACFLHWPHQASTAQPPALSPLSARFLHRPPGQAPPTRRALPPPLTRRLGGTRRPPRRLRGVAERGRGVRRVCPLTQRTIHRSLCNFGGVCPHASHPSARPFLPLPAKHRTAPLCYAETLRLKHGRPPAPLLLLLYACCCAAPSRRASPSFNLTRRLGGTRRQPRRLRGVAERGRGFLRSPPASSIGHRGVTNSPAAPLAALRRGIPRSCGAPPGDSPKKKSLASPPHIR